MIKILLGICAIYLFYSATSCLEIALKINDNLPLLLITLVKSLTFVIMGTGLWIMMGIEFLGDNIAEKIDALGYSSQGT